MNDSQEFECSPARFLELEPDYAGLPAGAVFRYWTSERAYFEGAPYDGLDCGVYCDRVGQYSEFPVVWANVTLSKIDLNASDSSDVITFNAALQDDAGNTIPLNYSWHIKLTHETAGDVDRILMAFVFGSCVYHYTFNSGLPLGTWRIDESKFDHVILDKEYQVKLVQPVEFVVYRTLE